MQQQVPWPSLLAYAWFDSGYIQRFYLVRFGRILLIFYVKAVLRSCDLEKYAQ